MRLLKLSSSPRCAWLGLALALATSGGGVAAAQEGQEDGGNDRKAVASKFTGEPPSPAEVDRAIQRGVANLYARQKPEIFWERVPLSGVDPQKPAGLAGGQWGGATALATYALLAAGEEPGANEKLSAAINFLGNVPLRGVYAMGVRAQVWLNLPRRPEYERAMAADFRGLTEAIQGNDLGARRDGKGNPLRDWNVGLFDYTVEETPRMDLSVSQYGVLGLWAAARYGAEVPIDYWNAMETAWLRWQLPGGEWAYHGEPDEKHPGSLSLACAGVASLFITQDYLRSGPGCNGNYVNPAIDRGLEYVAQVLPYLLGQRKPANELQARQANVDKWTYYTLYGVERVGVASGLKYFGDVDWYADGARYLIDNQRPDGSWGAETDTAFALLFLVNGRQPAAFTKLAYAAGADERRSPWNQRSRDLANLVEFLEFSDEREVNWQIFRFGAVETVDEAVRELHDSPIAYLAGGGELALRPDDREAIKRYLVTGGMLLVNSDCGNRRFEQAVVEMGNAMFAEEGYEFRPLPDSHPIYTAQKFKMNQLRRKPALMGLSNGVRELIVMATDDPAQQWQVRNLASEEPFHLGVNLYLYAVGNEDQQRPRGSTPLVQVDESVKTDKRVSVGRVRWDGNWNPEPAGWRRMVGVMHNEYRTALDVAEVDAATDPLGDYDVLHLTGTGELSLPDGAAAKLKAYVDGGGTLLVDAAGGDDAFAESAERVLGAAMGAEVSDPLPTSHAIYRAAGKPIEVVDYTLFARRTLSVESTPRLRGIETGGRLGVIVSREDLSHGLVGSPVGGIQGYAPDDAVRLTASALLHAAGGGR